MTRRKPRPGSIIALEAEVVRACREFFETLAVPEALIPEDRPTTTYLVRWQVEDGDVGDEVITDEPVTAVRHIAQSLDADEKDLASEMCDLERYLQKNQAWYGRVNLAHGVLTIAVESVLLPAPKTFDQALNDVMGPMLDAAPGKVPPPTTPSEHVGVERSVSKVSIALGDGIDGLLSLPQGSVALVLSDLPSGETQAPFDHAPDLTRMWPAIWHALSPSGVAVVMASSLSFASALYESQSDYFRYDLVWHKSVATGFLNARSRPLRAHEFILVFSRGKAIYTPQMVTGASPIHAARQRSHGENYGRLTQRTESRAGATDRYPTSVLEFASVGTSSKDRRHPQQKPDGLLRWLIRTYSAVGDLIVDPFAGSGSTGVAAVAEGRKFAGWDVDPRFGHTSVKKVTADAGALKESA